MRLLVVLGLVTLVAGACRDSAGPKDTPRLSRGGVAADLFLGTPTISILDALGAASPTTQFGAPGSGGISVLNVQFVGPEFVLTKPTTITEIGGFLNLNEGSQPFIVQVRPSTSGLPSATTVLASFTLSSDNNRDVISYESVSINLTLGPGTYFALFAPQGGEEGAVLNSATDPFTYRAGSVTMGFLNPTTADASVSTQFMAVRILGVPATPQAAIQLLADHLRMLVVQGVLSPDAGAGLLAKLTVAIPSLNRGRTNAACSQLGAFVNQLNGLTRAGKLAAVTAQDLIDAAEGIRTQIGCVGAALADLTIGALAETPANPTSGNIITLSGVVSNSGGTAAGPSTVSLCAMQFSGGTCAVFQGPGVPAGGSAQVSATIGALLPGTWTITASVDTFNVVPESNEANNKTIGPSFTVVAANSWTTVAPMPTPRQLLAVGVVNGILYAVGGLDQNVHPVSTVEAYDPMTNSWSAKAPMPTPRADLAIGVVGGILYAIGGSGPDPNGIVGTVEAYDPGSNTWTTKAPLPTPRRLLAAGVVNGVLYAVGGYSPGSALGVVEAYDPATNTWTARASLLTPRLFLAAGTRNGLLYTIGGLGEGTGSEVESYNPTANTWTARASLPAIRFALAAGVVDDVLYAVGGTSTNGIDGAVERYDPVADSWTPRASLQTPRSALAAGVVDGVLYAVGGVDQTPIVVGTVEAYHP